MKKNLFYSLILFVLIVFIGAFVYCINFGNTVAIIGAMDDEISEIKSRLHYSRTVKQNDFTVVIGRLGKFRIILAKSGVGKVAASTTTQFLIDKYKPDYLINIGIAGSVSDNLKAGDMIIAEKMVQHDFDVTAFGCPRGYIDNGIEPDKPTIFYSDKKLVDSFKQEFKSRMNSPIVIGTVATGDIFVNQEKLKKQIRDEFSALAVDMECAAIAQSARKNNIPLVVIKTISDSENDSVREYKQNRLSSAQKSELILLSILHSL